MAPEDNGVKSPESGSYARDQRQERIDPDQYKDDDASVRSHCSRNAVMGNVASMLVA